MVRPDRSYTSLCGHLAKGLTKLLLPGSNKLVSSMWMDFCKHMLKFITHPSRSPYSDQKDFNSWNLTYSLCVFLECNFYSQCTWDSHDVISSHVTVSSDIWGWYWVVTFNMPCKRVDLLCCLRNFKSHSSQTTVSFKLRFGWKLDFNLIFQNFWFILSKI